MVSKTAPLIGRCVLSNVLSTAGCKSLCVSTAAADSESPCSTAAVYTDCETLGCSRSSVELKAIKPAGIGAAQGRLAGAEAT
jgi:hypothetical protein